MLQTADPDNNVLSLQSEAGQSVRAGSGDRTGSRPSDDHQNSDGDLFQNGCPCVGCKYQDCKNSRKVSK